MTDSLKLAEMQRTSIEFERQRHLANWFIKSSPHMATPPTVNSNGSSTNANNSNNSKAQKSNSGTKNGTITTANPLFFLVSGQKPPPLPPQQLGGNLALSRSQIFTSQTNLPLQIVTSSAQEGRKPKLRRFNSHDTSANMFSVADFENARLARRNEIEMRQRLQQRLKMNSLSSGGDCSTGDSKGSKYSNDSQAEPLPADVFLDRYSLPRVVRISHKSKFSHETLQSSSSNGSSSTNSSSSLVNKSGDMSKQNGELFLLYRYLRQRKIYHGYNTKTSAGNRKKGIKIPQEFPGFFSLLNDKGIPTATMYTALVQLVRERVYKFVSVDNLPAFAESQNTEGIASRPHYIKSTARGGQVFRLLAVFEDGKENSSNSKNAHNTGREKEKGRYAQLLNENRQILYVSLSAKGKFYEVEPGVPQLLQKTGIAGETPKKINTDCVHRINNLITPDKELPINLKFISGPSGTASVIPENLTIDRISTENIVIACPIEDVESQSSLHLRKLNVMPELTFVKCFLGFENEQRMLANQNVQNILKFCQFNCDLFIKMLELEVLNRPERSGSRSRVDGLKILKPLHLPKLLRREKSVIAHEKEDSIIFLSKNDLANLESKEEKNSSQNQISDKMKVFQSTKKKWFKKSDKHTSLTSLDIDAQAKRMSMERYNDMSKLLQERFGSTSNEPVVERPTSEIGCSDKPKPHIQKSLSLQNVELIDKPDIVPAIYMERSVDGIESSVDPINDNDEASSEQNLQKHMQQSFISDKMYSEFHVKTRQYSKSSSSLHQLLHFAVPQRMNLSEVKKQPKQQAKKEDSAMPKKFEFNLNEPIEDISLMSVANTIIDDLPYSSVRDSLLISNSTLDDCVKDDEKFANQHTLLDEAKENIYAEICHDGGAVSRVQINVLNSSSPDSTNSIAHQSQSYGATCIDNIYNTLN